MILPRWIFAVLRFVFRRRISRFGRLNPTPFPIITGRVEPRTVEVQLPVTTAKTVQAPAALMPHEVSHSTQRAHAIAQRAVNRWVEINRPSVVMAPINFRKEVERTLAAQGLKLERNKPVKIRPGVTVTREEHDPASQYEKQVAMFKELMKKRE